MNTLVPFLLLGVSIGSAIAFRRSGKRVGFVLMTVTSVLGVLLCVLAVMIELTKRGMM